MTALTDITAQLAEPFSLDDIDLLPKGKVERDGKTLCMALPYADPRVYQDRLNQLAPGEWETPAPIALTVGDKLVTYVTVFLCGVVHTDVGEAGPGENQGTEAWAQAFKRACSQFGLGRYLYDLEKEWVPYHPQRKQIDLDGAGKQAIVRKMYQKAGISQIESVQVQPTRPALKIVDGKPDAEERLAQVKTLFQTLFKPERWDSFKQHHLGLPVSDDGLSLKELDKLYGELVQAKQQKASATAGK